MQLASKMYVAGEKNPVNINRKPLIENTAVEMIYSWVLTKPQHKTRLKLSERIRRHFLLRYRALITEFEQMFPHGFVET